jgi:hypothetical protein
MAANEAEGEFRQFYSVGTPTNNIKGADIASAAGALASAPNGYITVISGTEAVTLIPLPYAGFAGTIAVRPTGIFTGATGGVATATNKPIGLAFTAVVGKILFLTYDPVSELWYPSYTS